MVLLQECQPAYAIQVGFFAVNYFNTNLILLTIGCAAVVVACYSAGGFVFGTVTAGAGVPAAIVACIQLQNFYLSFNYFYFLFKGNTAFGACMAKCSVITALLP